MNGQQHVVKLRPGLDAFLRELSALYDLFIYTHGTRLYAEQIASLIDPKGTFFQHRIVARTDTPDMVHKSLKLLFPSSDDSMILVLDDRIDVWKENEGNVFLIEPYHYFKCTAEINNAAGHGVGGGYGREAGADADAHLTHARNQVHAAFYDAHDGVTVEEQMAGNGRDVKKLLGEQKRSVLKGCNIVFSGVFPISGQRGPESHYLWRLALDLGARPSMVMNDFPVTHLAKGTPDVFIVTPEWIFKCARTWERAPETDFLADEWKAKQEKLAAAAHEAATAEAAEASRAAEVGVPQSEPPVASDNAEPPPRDDDSETKAPVTGSEGDAVEHTAGSDVAAEATLAKAKKKSVSFAASVAGGEGNVDSETAGPVSSPPSASSLRQRRAPVRRVIGGARAGGVHIPEQKGVVASGGTFDFLSKITQIGASKREPRPVETPKPTVAASKAAAPEPAAARDVDDAFLRLIEAEERESAVESKRKLESDDVRDVLSARRLKKAKAAAASPTAPTVLAHVSSDDDDNDSSRDVGDCQERQL
ncbi:hypothetical protein PybrP1_010278 [[Pythium] brassicae (nom. inval.)]|nr:hypothetical protein PybrP1_010278 [[Pythium] brassicae (nom. inval.)]